MRKAKILTSLVIIGLASTLSVSGALAYHQNSSGNGLDIRDGSGGKDLRIVSEDSSPWTMGSMMPGESEPGKITLDHAGNSPATSVMIRLDLTAGGEASTESKGMATELVVTSMRYHGQSILEGVKAHLGAGEELTLNEMDGRTIGPEAAEELKDVPPADGPGGELRAFEMTIEFDEDAGNECQGSTVGFDVSFTLT